MSIYLKKTILVHLQKGVTNKIAFQLKQNSIFEIESGQYIENTQS